MLSAGRADAGGTSLEARLRGSRVHGPIVPAVAVSAHPGAAELVVVFPVGAERVFP
jgi:hypothetical protein